MWSNANVGLEDETVSHAGTAVNLTIGDWIALRRLGQAQSLTEEQAKRLVQLGLAQATHGGIVCSELGRAALQSRP